MQQRRRWAATILVTALISSFAVVAAAQEATTGAIEGRVVDAQSLALPGATVVLTGPQGSRTFVTDEQGRFLAAFVTPGRYEIRAELNGFRPSGVEGIVVGLGERVALEPITLRIGKLAEAVEVVASEPVVDMTTTTTGASLQSEFLSRLPTQRNVSDVVQLSAGVTDSGRVGSANVSISGASGLENHYVIDGINVSNPGYGGIGSYSIVFGSLGQAVPFDFVDEVQVHTGGYEAEFGQATGGIVRAVTKSGTNVFRGSGFTYWQPEAFVADFEQTMLPNATRGAEAVNTTDTFESDAGVEAGGPIWRDRMFFFGAIDRKWMRTSLIAPEGFPLRDLGPIDRERSALAYSGKVTYQINDLNRLDFSVFGDPSNGSSGPQRRTALLRTDLAGLSEIDYGGHNQTLRYESVVTPRWLLTASLAHASNSIEEFPSVNEWSVTDSTFTPDRISGGIGFYEVGNDGRNLQLQAKTTYFWKDHEFSGGVLVEDISYDNTIDRTGPSITLRDGTQTATGAQILVLPDARFGQIYRVTRANITNVRQTEQRYFAFFVQDTWEVGPRLTIKPGLRYEQQELVGNLESFTWDGNWAPRVGVTYDPTGEGRWKVFGSWGRFFAKIPNDLAARALSADAGVTRADYFDAGLTRPIPDGTPAGTPATETHFVTAGLSAADFDADSRSTYSDEWLVGTEAEVWKGLNVALSYQHRNFGRVLEDVGTLPMVAYFLEDVPGSDSVEYFITNPTPTTPVTGDLGMPISFEEPIHNYDAITVKASKRIGDSWGLQSSYRWSRLEGTFEGFFRNDNGQSDPAITSLFDFPTNDPSYTALGGPLEGFRGDIRYLGELGRGRLPLDRPHQFKVYGNRMFTNGLNVGLGLTSQSGTPLTAFAANPLYDSPGEIPETPRGAGIETVDGFRTRTPWTTALALHADYAFTVTGQQRLTLLADVFNLLNTKDVTNYDYYTETNFGVPNPDFGRAIAFQDPLTLRIGARYQW